MTHNQRWLLGSDRPLAEIHDVALVDLDGTVYVGDDAVPGAAAALERARESGMRWCYLTNNASRTPEAIAAHLRELDLPAAADQVVTSAQAAARLLSGMVPRGAKVLVVGGEGLTVALREEGLVPVSSADDEPLAVAQGFSPDVNWRMLAEGTLAIANGASWVASNADLTIPTSRGIAPGNGALVEVIRIATQATPRIAGKPEPSLVEAALERMDAAHPIVVGDRLDTDIECATRSDVPSLLVLTGVTDVPLLLRAKQEHRPTYLSHGMEGLLQQHDAPQQRDAGWICGGWRARCTEGTLRLDAPGTSGEERRLDALDGVRAACAAVWQALDDETDVDTSEALTTLSDLR